jgi:hypothetical protein
MTEEYAIKYLDDLRRCGRDFGLAWDMLAAVEMGAAALRDISTTKAERDEAQRNLREKVCIVERQRERIAELEKELATSQRREQAAVADINLVNSCTVCKHGTSGGGRFLPHCDKFKATKTPHDCDNFKWRGLREAEKGEEK